MCLQQMISTVTHNINGFNFLFSKVHVTKQTLELILDYAREYIIEPNFESQNDPFVMKNKLETYLLSRPRARVK